MWKSLCPLHRSVKSSLLHLQLPETWTPERLLMNQYSPLDAMAFKWVVVFCIYMLNASSVVLLLLMYDLSPYHQVSRVEGLRLQANLWKALAYKGSFLQRAPWRCLAFAWKLICIPSWRSRVFCCWMLAGCSLVFLFGPNSCSLSLFLFFSFCPVCLCQLEDNKEWKRWLFSEGVGQMRVF